MPLREVLAPGARRRRITPKAISVLAALIEQGGRVVSRDALLAQVWAGTLPTDDVVTQAISQLRKAFDDDRGNPRYIETIAKHGYRLLAPVELLDDDVRSAGRMPNHLAARPPKPVSLGEPKPSLSPAPTSIRASWRAVAAALAVAGLLTTMMLAWSMRYDSLCQARQSTS